MKNLQNYNMIYLHFTFHNEFAKKFRFTHASPVITYQKSTKRMLTTVHMKIPVVTRPLCLIESHTLDAACKVTGRCE